MIYTLLILVLMAVLWPNFLKRSLKVVAIGVACIVVLVAIIAAVPSTPNTPEEARKQLINIYVSAYADQDQASMAQIRACNDTDADDNVYFGGTKKFTQECKDATMFERYESESLHKAREAIVPAITDQEECTAKENYLKARGVDKHLCH